MKKAARGCNDNNYHYYSFSAHLFHIMDMLRMSVKKLYRKSLLAIAMTGLYGSGAWAEEVAPLDSGDTMVVQATAQEELKQQPGVSIITAKDIEKDPPVNDLSDIIRKMPGVNLTGNSASGSRGNNRQIDIRGMGPENTLILVDGVPVTSRNSVRYD